MRATPREVCSFKKESFKLSKIQKAVLVGTLLGDGGLRFRGKNCRLHIKHAKRQLPLVIYKRKIFSSITSMQTRLFNQFVGEKEYSFAEFVTLTHPVFTEYYSLFYRKAKKIVPINIGQLLTNPLSLAVWIMDDGSAEYAGLSIQTHSFNREEVERLIEVIRLNFRIETTKRLNKRKWIIYFPKSSLPKLNLVLKGLILPEFRYKLIPYSIKHKPRRDCTPEPLNIKGYDTVRSA